MKEETTIIPCKDELIGVTDECHDRSSYIDANLPYSVNILILGADDSFLDEDNNNQIIKDAPWRLIVGYDYPNLNEYKVKLKQQFDEAWFAGVGKRYHEKFNPISMMRCNVKCCQWHVFNGTKCANNQPEKEASDMRLGISIFPEDV